MSAFSVLIDWIASLEAMAVLVGLPAMVGYVLPPRRAPWAVAGMAAVVGAAWLLYDGSFHNDPWPFVVTPAAAGLIVGILIRLVQNAFRRRRIDRL